MTFCVQGIVKSPHIKCCAQPPLRLCAQIQYCELANLVTQRLTGPCYDYFHAIFPKISTILKDLTLSCTNKIS